MHANVLIKDQTFDQVSKLLTLIGQPARIQILLVISGQDACVCHFEAVLGMRQASISQHLMVLRKAGLVSTHRDGRNIFYHLMHPEVIDVLREAGKLSGINDETFSSLKIRPIQGCSCPQCNPDFCPGSKC
ncbi:MAG: helix-turn-helix transcriptional regulator [Leptolinea sp.]|jgi:ArsR family transcriptional regulator|nr:helix-turn-helix transcriptional regulator [Leptolinea sp.]